MIFRFFIPAFCVLQYFTFGLVSAQTILREHTDYTALSPEFTQIITIHLDHTPFDIALQEIAEKGHLKLVYSKRFLPEGTTSIHLENIPAVKAVFAVLENQNMEIKLSNSGQIIIAPNANGQMIITGSIYDVESGDPLENTHILVRETGHGLAADENGRFALSGLSEGEYTIVVSMVGYVKKDVDLMVTENNDVKNLKIGLTRAITSLAEIIVTPRHYAIDNYNPTTIHNLSQSEIKNMPKFGEDIFRSVARMPGVSTFDFSSRFSVRGSRHDEVLILLDGIELFDPFHLKEVDGGGVFSILDVDAMSGFEIFTGTFPVMYGNKNSGVLNLKSHTPEKRKTTLGLSLSNAKILSEGTFRKNKGSWLLSARKGFVDLLYNFTGNNIIEPNYYDIFGKLQYRVSDNHFVTAQFLNSNDEFFFKNKVDKEDALSSYSSENYWLNWKAVFGKKVYANTHIYRIDNSLFRKGRDTANIQFPAFSIHDDRKFRIYGLKQLWDIMYSDGYMASFGFEYNYNSAAYNYFNRKIEIEDENPNPPIVITSSKLDLTGKEFNFYFNSRIKTGNRIVSEAGVRFDYTSWSDELNLSPRLNTSFFVTPSTVLRGGWGRFYQSHELHKLDVQDSEESFNLSELSNQYYLGLEKVFKNGLNLKIEGYYKRDSDVLPVFLNLTNPFNTFFPEVNESRKKYVPENGTARGLEIFLKKGINSKFNWMTSYSFAKTEDRLGDMKVPGFNDRRHTLYLDLNLQPYRKLNINVGWQYYSGIPFTENHFEKSETSANEVVRVFDPINTSRLPDYHRMDLKITNTFESTVGQVDVFLELLNVYDRNNIFFRQKKIVPLPNGDFLEQSNNIHFFSFQPSFGIKLAF